MTELQRQHRTHAARIALRLKRKKSKGPNVWKKKAASVAGRRKRWGTIRYEPGFLALGGLGKARKTRRWRLVPRLAWAAKKALTYERARTRATKIKPKMAAPELCLFDQCLHTQQYHETMAWKQTREEPLVNWGVFAAQWVYNRSLRCYEKLDAKAYSHWRR